MNADTKCAPNKNITRPNKFHRNYFPINKTSHHYLLMYMFNSQETKQVKELKSLFPYMQSKTTFTLLKTVEIIINSSEKFTNIDINFKKHPYIPYTLSQTILKNYDDFVVSKENGQSQ